MGSPSSSKCSQTLFHLSAGRQTRKVNQDERCASPSTPDRLAGQSAPSHGDEVIKIENVLGAALHQNKHRAPGRALNHEEPLARKTRQFASNDIARYRALRRSGIHLQRLPFIICAFKEILPVGRLLPGPLLYQPSIGWRVSCQIRSASL